MGVSPPPDERQGTCQGRSRRPSQDGTLFQDELQGSYRAPNSLSGAKNAEESAGDVRFCVAPQKISENP